MDRAGLQEAARSVQTAGQNVLPIVNDGSLVQASAPSARFESTAQTQELKEGFASVVEKFISKINIFKKLADFVQGNPSESPKTIVHQSAFKPGEYISGRGMEAMLDLIKNDVERVVADSSRYSKETKLKIVDKRIDQLKELQELANNYSEMAKEGRGIPILKEKLEAAKEKIVNEPQGAQACRFASNVTPALAVLSREEAAKVAENQKKPFSEGELKTLAKLSAYTKAKNRGENPKLTPAEKKELAAVFVKATGNMAFNKQMGELTEKNKLAKLGIDPEIATMMRNFSFRTRGCEKAMQLAEKTEGLMAKIAKRQPIANEDKLSLEELGLLDNLLKAKSAKEVIEHLGLHEIDPSLKQLVASYKKTDLILGQIDLKLNKYSNYKAGDLIFQDNTKVKRYNRVKEKFQELLQTLVLGMPLHHAAVCCKGDNNRDQMSHVLNAYQVESFELVDKATMSGYRLDPAKLLNPKAEEILQEALIWEGGNAQGEYKNAQDEVRKMYQNIQNDIHSKGPERFKGIVNDMERRHDSGLAQIFTALHTGDDKPGRFEAMRQKLMGGDLAGKKMICSEFAAKTLIVGLVQQEEILYNKMLNHLVNNRGMTTSQARMYLAENPIFNMPIGENEKFSKLNPTRLLQLLSQQGCIDRLAPPPLLQGLVKAEDLAIHPDEAIIDTPNITGFNKDETRLEEMRPGQYVDVPEDKRAPPANPTLDDKWSDLCPPSFKAKILAAKRQGDLEKMIKTRREEIRKLKEDWRTEMTPSDYRNEVARAHGNGHLEACDGGMGGAYFLVHEGTPKFVIKPSDEDILCLNNRKVMASPFDGSDTRDRVRKGVPQYQSVQNEELAYKVAEQTGLAGITPKTEMVILKNNSFYDVTQDTREANGPDRDKFLQRVGHPDNEKLCSAQEFIPGSHKLGTFLSDKAKEAHENDLTIDQIDDSVSRSIDPQDFEECLIFNCITGETDGNDGNYMVYVKSEDDKGNKLYGLKKVDNALTFPDTNDEYSNCLSNLAHIDNKLSPQAKQRILAINVDQVAATMKQYHKSDQAIEAYKERMALLQNLARVDDITLREIDDRMENLAKKSRRPEAVARAPAAEAAASGTEVHAAKGTVAAASGTMVQAAKGTVVASGTMVQRSTEAVEKRPPAEKKPNAATLPEKDRETAELEEIVRRNKIASQSQSLR